MNRVRTSALSLSILFALTGCADTPARDQAFTMSTQEIQEALDTPKLEGYMLSGGLEFIAMFGSGANAASKSSRVVGIVQDILPMESHRTTMLPIEKIWVPIIVQVEQANPELTQETIVVRVFPNSENMPDISKLYKGQRILAVGVEPTIDEADMYGVSLGWLLEIETNDQLRDLNPKNKVTGTFTENAVLFGLSPNR